MRRILITGGYGYIGTNLKRFLYLYGGRDVVVDISDYNSIIPLAQDLTLDQIEKYDCIIHLAALSGIMACEENYLDALESNLLTAINVFSKATEFGIPVVFTSSQAVKNPFSSKYANLKFQCEQFAELYNNRGGSIYTIRLANVYGGNQYLEKKNTVIKQLIIKYNGNLPMELHGDGKQTRDFIHVHDICRAILLILDKTPTEKSPMDIGSGVEIKLLDIVNDMFPRKQNNNYVFLEDRSAGASSSVADTSEAKKRIGFETERNLKDYIRSMI